MAETLSADQDVRTRLRSCGPDALTPVEALTVLLGERSLVPAARLLAAFGSLTALVRATPAQLARWVSEEQAWRLDGGPTPARPGGARPRPGRHAWIRPGPFTNSPCRRPVRLASHPSQIHNDDRFR